MKPTMLRLLPLFCLLASGLPAQAQRVSSPYRFIESSQEIGGLVTHVWPDEGSVGLGATSGVAFGARYAIRIGGAFMIEAQGLYFPTQHAVLDTTVVDSAFQQISTADQTLVVATAALRFNLTGSRTWHSLQPFFLFGGGAVIQTSSDDDEVNKAPENARFDFGTSFAGTLGAGIAWLPSSQLAIRVDGRNVLWKLKTPLALLNSELGRTVPQDEWLQNFTVSAGVSILF